jgi:membrane-bound lytic murein transglycosylase B
VSRQHPQLDRIAHAAKLPAVAVLAVALAVTATAAAANAGDEEPTPAPSSVMQGPVVQPHRDARFALVQPQAVEPSTTLVARKDKHRKVRVDSPRGGHVFTASQLASHDLPEAALSAYKRAATTMASTDPTCHLPWTLLAAIGRVESDHGRYGGSVLATDGVSRPAIIGIALNGKGPVAAIRDTDGGKLDGDEKWDRAVGPMQFIPSTWAWAGRDGDGDGKQNPHDIDDAALSAADYLCSGVDLRDSDAMDAAILRYNPSDYYVALVRAFEVGYRTGVFVIPSPDAPEHEKKDKKSKRHKDAKHAKDSKKDGKKADGPKKKKDTDKPKADPKPKPKADPTPSPKPKPKPSPTPTPTPTPPPVETVTGPLAPCGAGWCLAGVPLDLGPAPALQAPTPADYDGDGIPETLNDELTGLAALGPVTVRAERTNGVLVVREIAGRPFPR